MLAKQQYTEYHSRHRLKSTERCCRRRPDLLYRRICTQERQYRGYKSKQQDIDPKPGRLRHGKTAADKDYPSQNYRTRHQHI